MATQEVDETGVTYEISGSELTDAMIPTLLANQAFLTKLANSPAFITALSSSPGFKKLVATQAGAVAGAIIVKGLGR